MLVAVGLLVLLVSKETFGLEDGWIVNVTSSVYGIAWDEDYAKSNSIKFKDAKNLICGQINDIFRREPVAGNEIKERYLTCHIGSFRKHIIPMITSNGGTQSNLNLDAPVSFTYSLVFNGSAPVPKSFIDALLMANIETFHIGTKIWMFFGDTWLINRNRVELVRVNVSDFISHKNDKRQGLTKENNTVIQIIVQPNNLTWTPKMSDPASQEYQDMTSQFCRALEGMFQGRLQSYKACSVSSFFKNKVDGSTVLTSDLMFGQAFDSAYPLVISALIVENSPRQNIGGKINLIVGPFSVLEESVSVTFKAKPDENNTVIQLIVQPNNLTWTPKMSDPASQEYQDMTSQFCRALEGMFQGRLQSYKACSVSSFFKNKVDGSTVLTSDLMFGQAFDSAYPLVISALIVENSPRQNIGGKINLIVGPLSVLEESVSVTFKAKPDGALCSQKANDILSDASNISNYLLCHVGKAYRFTCGPTKIFDGIKKKCSNVSK